MDILKIIELLNKNEIEEAKKGLKELYLKQTNKTSYNLYNQVKKYLKSIDSRPELKAIQHTGTNQQFILNGYSLIIFNEYKKELEEFEQIEAASSLKTEKIADFSDPAINYIFDEDDLIILNNLNKYIKLNKINFEQYPAIFFKNQYFNAKLLAEFWEFFKNNNNMVYNIKNQWLYIKSKEVNGVCLPLNSHVMDNNEIKKIEDLTTEFLQELKRC